VALILVPNIVCVCLILHNLCIPHGDNFDVQRINVIEHGTHDNLNASILQQQAPKRKAITQDFLEKLQGIHRTMNESLNCMLNSTNYAFQVSMKNDGKTRKEVTLEEMPW